MVFEMTNSVILMADIGRRRSYLPTPSASILESVVPDRLSRGGARVRRPSRVHSSVREDAFCAVA